MEYKDKIRVRKYKDIIRRYDLSKIDYRFKLFCRKYSPCYYIDEGYNYYFKEMKRMTIGTIISNMLFQDLISDDGDIASKMKLLIEFYIKEELEDYFNEFWETSNKDC